MFVPGADDRKIEKSFDLDCDVLIFDLEDAVADGEKDAARRKVKEALGRMAGSKPCYVRINFMPSPFFEKDLEWMVDRHTRGIVLPKVESAEQIRLVHELIGMLERKNGVVPDALELVPMIETARGLHHSYEIASASPRVRRLAFGSLDFCRDIGAAPSDDGTELLYARSMLVVNSRAAGIEAPIDTVFVRVKDEAGLIREAGLARQLGFRGKLLIHPAQIGPVHAVFRPSGEEVQWARFVLSAYEKALQKGEAAVLVDGSMVDLPVVERARKILQYGGR
jgi:citrate lyase subunit beta/citryl-CoA lyase